MRKINLFLLGLVAVYSCKNAPNNDLIGTYQLTHVQQDFGPDANKEIAVTSKKTCEFKPNGVIISQDGQLCSLSHELDSIGLQTEKPVSTGTYDINTKAVNISPCGPMMGAIKYEHTGQEVILYFGCNNVCKQRFKKIK
jgi:hypothetical protein